jgi:HK97 gp10 family phage protein
MDVTVNVSGLKGLEDALVEFAPALVKKAFRAAAHAADEPIIATAKQLAPVMKEATKNRQPGELRDSITEKITLTRTGVRAIVGPRRGKGESNQSPGTWGLMEEFGSIHNPPQPYLRPAFDARNVEAVDRFATVLRSAIDTMKAAK